jgi:hypothetical protein
MYANGHKNDINDVNEKSQASIIIIFRVKYVWFSCSLKIFIFCPCSSFRIIDGISFMAKDENGTSV